ncbi:hypothetical protein LY76DRAFT_422314 [Colletotrichum caudatum]|nr:hypothetical protein LY76DRAFT_422314 [Colletotrichum caudatum]
MAAPRQAPACSRKLWNRIKLRSSLFLFVLVFPASSTSDPIPPSVSFNPFKPQTNGSSNGHSNVIASHSLILPCFSCFAHLPSHVRTAGHQRSNSNSSLE